MLSIVSGAGRNSSVTRTRAGNISGANGEGSTTVSAFYAASGTRRGDEGDGGGRVGVNRTLELVAKFRGRKKGNGDRDGRRCERGM